MIVSVPMKAFPIPMVLFAAISCAAAENLVPDAGFAAGFDTPASWKKTYAAPGESWYKDNAALVSVVSEGDRKSVLRLHVATQFLADNPGVKTESAPIPFDPASAYVFSAEARSTGPAARIMLEGYRLRNGAPKSAAPDRADLRLVYRFPILTFRPGDSTETARPGPAWTRARLRVPSEALTPMARRALGAVEFVVVRVVAIAGKSGELRVHDIRLEKDAAASAPAKPAEVRP